MLVYIVLLLSLFFLANTRIPIRRTQKLYRLVCFILALLLGFRSNNVGVDTLTYAEYYRYASYNIGHMEVGWNTLIFLCKQIGLSSHGFNFIIAVITFISIAIPLEKVFTNDRNWFLGLFFLVGIGFYFLMFNGMRQTTAIGLCFYAFYIAIERKIIKASIIVLLASTIHISCLVALPALFIDYTPKLRLLNVVVALTISMLIGLFATKDFFIAIAGSYSYDIIQEGSFNQSPILYFCTMVLLSNAFFLFIMLKTPKSFHDNYWLKLYFIALVIQGMLFQLTYGQRIVYYYSISAVILFPLLVSKFKNQKTVSLACYLFAFAFFLRFILQEVPGAPGSLVPYSMTFKPF